MGTSVVNRSLPFILMPIMTKFLAPAEYGYTAMYQALISFAVPFVGMNMQNNIARHYFKRPQAELAKLIGNLLMILSASTTIVMLALAVYLLFFKSLAGIPAGWLYTIPPIAAAVMINQFNLVILRNQEKAFAFGLFEISNTITHLVLTVLFVAVIRLGWQGRSYATLGASVLFGIIGVIHLARAGFLKWQIDRAEMRDILKISLPLIPYSLGTIIIFLSDRLFIDRMMGKAAVGLYAVGYSFGMIVTLVNEAANRSYTPWLYKQLANLTEAAKVRIVRYSYLYYAGVLAFALAVTGVSHVLLRFMANERYQAAGSFIIWIALGNAVNGMYAMLVPYSVNEGRTKPLAMIMGFAAIVNLVANYYMIKANGALGAAQATLLAYAVAFVINFAYVQRICPLPWFGAFKKY